MTHREKVDYLISDLTQRGIKRRTIAPPHWRMVWKLGWLIPPPHFMGFFALTLLCGSLPCLLLELFMWFMGRSYGLNGRLILLLSGGASGVLCGLIGAASFRLQAAKLGLPPWERYPEP
jgi:hypothetical protein